MNTLNKIVVKVELKKGDTLDLYTHNSKRDYDLQDGTIRSYFEGKIIRRLYVCWGALERRGCRLDDTLFGAIIVPLST